MEIVVKDLSNIQVKSGTSVDVWYKVDAKVGSCECLGFLHRGGCRHLKGVAEHLREMGLMEGEMPQNHPEQETFVALPDGMPTIYTSTYGAQNVLSSGEIVPVQTSLGAPKFPTRYELIEEFKLMMPDYAMLGMGRSVYRQAYLDKMNRIGVSRQADVLVKIGARAPGLPLALLCFEATQGPKAGWCHRHLWAEWFEQVTGMQVLELADDGETVPWEQLPVYNSQAKDDNNGQQSLL